MKKIYVLLSIILLIVILLGMKLSVRTHDITPDSDNSGSEMNTQTDERSDRFYIPTKQEEEFYEYLLSMAYKGEVDSVKNIIETCVNLKYDNGYCNPILHAAVQSGSIELAQYLIEKGANVKTKTRSNETALHIAARQGNLEMTKFLVEKGADINIIYNVDMSPLSCAAESGDIETVKYLISKGAETSYIDNERIVSPLFAAAHTAHYDIFLLLAQMQPRKYNWQEALIFGIQGGSIDIVKYIVEKKDVDVNEYYRWAYPIEIATNDRYPRNKKAQHIEVVRYLISKGARLTDNIFEKVMSRCSEDMMECLIEQAEIQGVDIIASITAYKDWTPLPMALDHSSFALAKYFIKKTKDYTFRNTPLIVYFADGLYNSPEIIELLIKEGINKEYYTEALLKSVVHDDSVSVHLLLDAGADVSNSLHLIKSYSIAKLLIEKGADVNNKEMLKNSWENPPLLKALDEKNIRPPYTQSDLNIMLANAAEIGDLWTLEYALKRGADVNSFQLPPPDYDGKRRYNPYKQTPLIKNTMQGYLECKYSRNEDYKVQVSPRIAEILLKAGADLNLVDSEGKAALHYASGGQCRGVMGDMGVGSRIDREMGSHAHPKQPTLQYHDSIAQLLIRNGAELNIRDNDGNTPLILAAQYGNREVLKMLLEAKADVIIRDNKGNDARSYLKRGDKKLLALFDDYVNPKQSEAASDDMPETEDDFLYVMSENDNNYFHEGTARVKVDGKWGLVGKDGKWLLAPEYDWVSSFIDGLAIVMKEGWSGVIDIVGRKVVPLRYDRIHLFSEGLAHVMLCEKEGFIDETGKKIIPLIYDEASGFKGGLARVNIGEYQGLGGKWGFIDKSGKEIVPLEYEMVWDFVGGMAVVMQNGQLGFVNSSGVVVVPPRYARVDDFSEGLAVVCHLEKWGVIDITGKEVIPVKYDYMKSFSDGVALVVLNNKHGFIDKKGNEVVPIIYDDIEPFSEGLAQVKLNGKYGFVNKSGKVVVPIKYDWVGDFKNNFVNVSLSGRYGYIDKEGSVVIPIKYERVGFFSDDGLILTLLNDEVNFIDTKGNVVISVNYEDYYGFSEGLANVKKDGKWGSINKIGKMVIPLIYDSLAMFKGGMAAACLNGKWGIIDKKADKVIPFNYEKIGEFSNNQNAFYVNFHFKDDIACLSLHYDEVGEVHEDMVKVKSAGKCGFVDIAGELVVPLIYDNASDFENGFARVYLNSKWGFINKTGAVAIPLKYDNAGPFRNDMAMVYLNKKWGYIDKTGKVIVPVIYDWVDFEFDEYVSVELNGKYYYYDRQGKRFEASGNFFNR